MEEDVKKGKHIFSVLFIISLFLFSGFNIFFHGPVLLEEIKENREGSVSYTHLTLPTN